ncbi:BCCT family transporter, partial [Escherichia coli]|uniref:BCCT family transporter n=1 Tax=Escherichia coli TaxID=562 RepID=UPI001C37E7B8
FFWAWWVAWSPFVGLFLARISRGRTIRQFVLGTLIIPFTFTLEAINEVGMHDATIAQIARRAGVSTGIISHYFRDKNGLLEA